MSKQIEESKLTAYALGELDEQGRREVEALLQRDETMRQEVEQIRAVAGMLKEQLAAEPMPEPSREPIAKPRVPIALVPATMKLPRRPRWGARLALAAACVVIGGILYSVMLPPLNQARKVAHTSQKSPPVQGQTNVSTIQPQALPSVDKTISDQYASDHPAAIVAAPESDASFAPGSNPSAVGYADFATGADGRHGSEHRPKPQRARGDGNAELLYGIYHDQWDRRSAHRALVSQSLDDTAAYKPDDIGLQRSRRLLPQAEEIKPLGERRTGFNTEAYDRITDNAFLQTLQNPLSTFSIDVDTASYSNIRRFLQAGQRPPKDAVRIEELLNYFPYDYAPPEKKSKDPFAAHVEIAGCPWNSDHRLVRVALKGKEIAADKRPASNLVFLIDVSGSMNEPNKLPLVKSSLRMLTQQLGGEDRVAMVVYAGNAGLVLPSTSCRDGEKQSILNALDNLEAGGSTNGAQGIELAYQTAQDHFIKGGTNRVILCTDGDFNVGVTNQGDLTRLIEDKAKSGVFLSVMGFGMDNLKDSTMEKLADKGNGNYGYIDTASEAKKVFVEEISSTLVTIAKDVKIQIEFNPAVVGSYRLIGYENRMLAKEDFNNDKKDAGEIGAGHAVTALYEVAPVGEAPEAKQVDDLHFQKPAQPAQIDNDHTGDMLILKLRYKQPEADKSDLIEITVKDDGETFAKASDDLKFASSVAAFGMILRDSPYKGSANYGAVLEWAEMAKGKDVGGYRKEFVEMVKRAQSVKSE